MVPNGINILPLSVLKLFNITREMKVLLNSLPIKSLSRSPLVQRVNAGVNLDAQKRGHCQGHCTVSRAASSTEGWEHADLENRCFGSFRLCRNTFDTLRVHHTGNDVQSVQANRLLVSQPNLIWNHLGFLQPWGHTSVFILNQNNSLRWHLWFNRFT